jgi:hypothetical protein
MRTFDPCRLDAAECDAWVGYYRRRWPEQRAEAARISDRWVDDGCDPESPALPVERALLVRSYAALLAAVHR